MERCHATLDWRGRALVLRDLRSGDLERIADYWSGASDEYLERLGVDGSALRDRDWVVERFAATIPTGDPAQPRQAFAIELDGLLIGYTNVNCYAPHRNFSHWHLIDAGWRGCGISTSLYPWRLRTYFACTRMETLTHQTRVSNIGVNRMLDRFVPVAETRFVADPDGLSLPGEFHLRHVTRADAARIAAAVERELPPARGR